MLNAGLVDSVGVGVIPVLLGGGIPFLNPPAKRVTLEVTNHRLYTNSGIVILEYDVVGKEPPAAVKRGNN